MRASAFGLALDFFGSFCIIMFISTYARVFHKVIIMKTLALLNGILRAKKYLDERLFLQCCYHQNIRPLLGYSAIKIKFTPDFRSWIRSVHLNRYQPALREIICCTWLNRLDYTGKKTWTRYAISSNAFPAYSFVGK